MLFLTCFSQKFCVKKFFILSSHSPYQMPVFTWSHNDHGACNLVILKFKCHFGGIGKCDLASSLTRAFFIHIFPDSTVWQLQPSNTVFKALIPVTYKWASFFHRDFAFTVLKTIEKFSFENVSIFILKFAIPVIFMAFKISLVKSVRFPLFLPTKIPELFQAIKLVFKYARFLCISFQGTVYKIPLV